MPADPHVLHEGHHPTPFTADEIRAASPAGRVARVRIDEPGEPPRIRQTRFVEVDADGAVMEYLEFDLEGRPLGEPDVRRSRWLDLQNHASMPIASTVIEREVIESPLGTLACSRYTRRDGDEVLTFWFAHDLPGMPVRVEVRSNDRLVERTEMIEKRTGTSAPATR